MSDEYDQQEWAEESDWVADDADEDDPEGDLLPCPSCGEMIYDDTDRCPYCGNWVMPMAAASSRRSRVWLVAVILVIISFLVWFLR